MQNTLNTYKADYEDIIKSTLRVQGPERGARTLEKMGEDLRKTLESEESETMKNFPAYAGLAFRGCLRFVKKDAVTTRTDRADSARCLAEVRAAAAVEIAERAQKAWVVLRDASEETAWAALVLVATEHWTPDPKTNPDGDNSTTEKEKPKRRETDWE